VHPSDRKEGHWEIKTNRKRGPIQRKKDGRGWVGAVQLGTETRKTKLAANVGRNLLKSKKKSYEGKLNRLVQDERYPFLDSPSKG